MYENIFNRVEQKYIITKEEKEEFLKLIGEHIVEDQYHDSLISNIYFDDINNRLIINSLEKPLYKEKVRIRCYGETNIDSNVFFEIKNKYKGVVGKRRIMIKLDDLYKYLDGKINIDNQILNEIDYLVKYYGLKPAIFISYHRYSYISKDDENLRITFDRDLISRRNDLRLEKGIYGDKYFDNDEIILEVKTLNGYPMWLVEAFNKLKIYPESFSKYGSIYSKEVMEEVYV